MTPAAPSTGRRRRGRELALRVLFEIEGTAKDPEFALRYQGGDLRATADVLAFARTIVVGCVEHLDAIDTAIAAGMDNWTLVDLGKVERAVLRLGTFELLYTEKTPVPVVIDESIELAKSYAGDEAAQFVNGVLGHVARERV
ncbi:MAG TPA: transcription antitermination factor NusB [Candidatus Saccharimonadales bacterium]|nr:transcription antitermination factor NusB [Candidatus Saccharimonadales bacterium]